MAILLTHFQTRREHVIAIAIILKKKLLKQIEGEKKNKYIFCLSVIRNLLNSLLRINFSFFLKKNVKQEIWKANIESVHLKAIESIDYPVSLKLANILVARNPREYALNDYS